MQTANMSEFRKDLKKYLNIVTDDHETVIINRGDKKAAVVMSLDEYNSLTETNYLFSTEANRQHLLQSIQQVNEGKIIRKDLIEE
ncbi:MAG: type II toxin-antitoxin system prevent-host-death family antitoxin [Bacteroidales bacterium]|nr:type II toxin-antitoxin system prevent-host-death family antitoxin [Bacteroidales bacterium]